MKKYIRTAWGEIFEIVKTEKSTCIGGLWYYPKGKKNRIHSDFVKAESHSIEELILENAIQ